jgi:hypothetical protein
MEAGYGQQPFSKAARSDVRGVRIRKEYQYTGRCGMIITNAYAVGDVHRPVIMVL